jgi:hypothetical protein
MINFSACGKVTYQGRLYGGTKPLTSWSRDREKSRVPQSSLSTYPNNLRISQKFHNLLKHHPRDQAFNSWILVGGSTQHPNSTTHCAYPSIDGHSGCVHLLVIVNNDAMNLAVEISIESLLPEMQLLDHMEILFSIFEEPPYCFS